MNEAHILIVEDEKIVATEIKAALQDLGYPETASATTGKKALEILQNQNIDLILMDIKIQGDMDGIETAKQIHLQFGIPIIFLTAYSDHETVERAKISEPFGYILKPFDKNELRSSIEIALYKAKMEKTLQCQKQWLSTILNNIDDAVLAVDLQGQVTFMNPAAEVLTGWKEKQARNQPGESIFRLQNKELHETIDKSLFEYFESGSKEETQFGWLKTKENKTIYIEYTHMPILDEKQTIIGYIDTFRDATKRKETEDNLRRAKEAAEATSKAKSQFLSNMSHEIRTPMNGIIGMTDLTLDTNLTDQQRRYLAHVKNSADDLLHLLNDILDLSKIADGKLNLHKQEFNLNDLMQDMEDTFSPQAQRKGLHLSTQTSFQNPCWVYGDLFRLRQIMGILIGNAIKFTDMGEVKIHVQKEQTISNLWRHIAKITKIKKYPSQNKYKDTFFKFSISDTGIGIPEDQIETIFDQFHQIDGSATRKHNGIGLGLTLCKKLIEIMEGDIWVNSQEGKGSTFHFFIRLELLRDLKKIEKSIM